MAFVLTEQIEVLVQLQKVDAEIHRLKKELALYPDREKALTAEFENTKSSLKAAEDGLKNVQKKQKDRELDLASKEEKIAKLSTQLYQLKSNKEYAAMELEIKGIKADNSLLEEDILKCMDAVEEAKKTVAKEKALLVEEEKKFKTSMDALKKESAALEAEIQAEEAKRKEFLPKVDSKLLVQYERLLKGREGLALVPVVEEACGGCHMGLPPQTVNEVHLKEKLITCESCARMLYWPT